MKLVLIAAMVAAVLVILLFIRPRLGGGHGKAGEHGKGKGK